MNRISFRWIGRLAAAISLVGGVASAQEYPNRPIRVMIPIGAGGPTDVVGRMILDRLSKELNTPIIVDNKPGASGLIGSREVARSVPDGYTLLYTVGSFYTASPQLIPGQQIDMQKEFIPISFGHNQNMALVVNAQLPVNNFTDLVSFYKMNPMLFGSPGTGSGPHLIMEVLKKRTGFERVHVPYKSGGEATQATVSGQVNATIEMVSNIVGQIDAGSLRAVAVTGGTRNAALPDVRTLRELGIDFESSSWGALAAPAGTPQPIINRLRQAMVVALNDPELLAKLDKLGAGTLVASADELRDRIAKDTVMWGEVIRDLGLEQK